MVAEGAATRGAQGRQDHEEQDMVNSLYLVVVFPRYE